MCVKTPHEKKIFHIPMRAEVTRNCREARCEHNNFVKPKSFVWSIAYGSLRVFVFRQGCLERRAHNGLKEFLWNVGLVAAMVASFVFVACFLALISVNAMSFGPGRLVKLLWSCRVGAHETCDECCRNARRCP